MLPLLGSNIPWPRRAMMLVTAMRSYASVNDRGKVDGPPAPFPYAVLTVEMLTEAASMTGTDSDEATLQVVDVPIEHREDFKVMYYLAEVHGLLTEEVDVVADFQKRGGFGKVFPRLSVDVHQEGYWQAMMQAMRGDHSVLSQRRQPRLFGHERGPFKWPRD